MKVDQTDFLQQYNTAKIQAEKTQNQSTNKMDDTKAKFQEMLDSYQNGDGKEVDFSSAYKNPSLAMDTATVENLMQESKEIQGSVHQLIRGLLDRQGITIDMLKEGEVEEVTVDELAREKAAKLIGPGGELSPEKVSDRIVGFSIAVFGGDTSKVDVIRGAIGRGFDEAEKMMGGLADVSKETYDLIQDKLDKWVEEGNKENPEEHVDIVE